MTKYNEGQLEMNWVHAFLQCEPFRKKVLSNFDTPRGK
jgi:hypothetical protein